METRREAVPLIQLLMAALRRASLAELQEAQAQV
jgi:hypothetical protein